HPLRRPRSVQAAAAAQELGGGQRGTDRAERFGFRASGDENPGRGAASEEKARGRELAALEVETAGGRVERREPVGDRRGPGEEQGGGGQGRETRAGMRSGGDAAGVLRQAVELERAEERNRKGEPREEAKRRDVLEAGHPHHELQEGPLSDRDPQREEDQAG